MMIVLSRCRLDRAASRVYRLAMLDFTNSRLVSSCVAFTEMCERDSTLLRVDSQAAIRMARYTRDTTTKGGALCIVF